MAKLNRLKPIAILIMMYVLTFAALRAVAGRGSGTPVLLIATLPVVYMELFVYALIRGDK